MSPSTLSVSVNYCFYLELRRWPDPCTQCLSQLQFYCTTVQNLVQSISLTPVADKHTRNSQPTKAFVQLRRVDDSLAILKGTPSATRIDRIHILWGLKCKITGAAVLFMAIDDVSLFWGWDHWLYSTAEHELDFQILCMAAMRLTFMPIVLFFIHYHIFVSYDKLFFAST